MTHLNELEGFDAACRDYLRDLFPGAEMDYQKYLPQSTRFIDFLVVREMPGDDRADAYYVVETEDTFDGVVESIGQVQMYAGHFGFGAEVVPIILFPEGHVEQPEFDYLRGITNVLLQQVPPNYEPDGVNNGDE